MKAATNNLTRALRASKGRGGHSAGAKGGQRAFSLIELMIAVTIFFMTAGAAIAVYIMCQKLWHATSLSMAASRDGSMAMARMVYGVGSNNGLRAASSVSIIYSNSAWTGGTNYPPQPGATNHYLTSGASDGSWRLICINPFDGTNWIDFNKKASNIVYWMDTSQSSRQLICNYVSAAAVSNNALGLNIQLTILRRDGPFTSTNQVGTFVLMRNRLL